MGILTGGYALWIGGWTNQVHHHHDVISSSGLGSLVRPEEYMRAIEPTLIPDGPYGRLPPAYALIDNILFKDHRIIPADEIDIDYLEDSDKQDFHNAIEHIQSVLGPLNIPEAYLDRFKINASNPDFS